MYASVLVQRGLGSHCRGTVGPSSHPGLRLDPPPVSEEKMGLPFGGLEPRLIPVLSGTVHIHDPFRQPGLQALVYQTAGF